VRTFLDSATGLLVKPVSGRGLQICQHHFSPTLRAVLAHNLQNGTVALVNLSPRQAAMITGTRLVDARTVRDATPLEVVAMRADKLAVADVRRQQLSNRPISDKRLKRVIERAGLSRVFDLLDELTRPAGKTNGHATGHDNDNNGNGGAAMPLQLSL
jgi:hypothetical protein